MPVVFGSFEIVPPVDLGSTATPESKKSSGSGGGGGELDINELKKAMEKRAERAERVRAH